MPPSCKAIVFSYYQMCCSEARDEWLPSLKFHPDLTPVYRENTKEIYEKWQNGHYFFEFGEFEIRFLCNKRKLHYEINKLYPILRALSVRMVFEILFDSLRFQPEFRSQIVFQAEFRLKFK